MGYALMLACSSLKNVTWETDSAAASTASRTRSSRIEVPAHALGHRDQARRPDTKARENFAQAARSTRRSTGERFAAFGFGHYHKGRHQIGGIRILWNGALLPPNGHARTMGYEVLRAVPL